VRTHERLVEDLGIDSLDMADLLVGIENNLGVVIDAEALASIQTVMHLEDAVAERVAAVA
jgi:acyl carrier protein